MITAHLISDKVASNSEAAFSLFEKSRFGEKNRNKITYSWPEALFLFHQNKLKVHNSKHKILTESQLITKARKHDKNISTKLAVFSDLRKKGYIVKTALKFGAEFRVYNKSVRPGQDHARWICFPVKESEKHSWYDFAAKNRVSHSSKKKLLIAIVDDEEDVTYYEVSWLKP
jgi:tRNA-intron endonuclease, archaea type